MFNGNNFIIAIIAITTIGWVLTTWIRARHGYPINDDLMNLVGKEDPEGTRKIGLLTTENERLNGQISRLEERIAVLERIATDPAVRTAREIDELR